MNDFSKKTLKQLSKKGILLTGSQAVPAFDGDTCFSGTAYKLSYNDTGFVRSHSQVIVIAQSSWNPETDLDIAN